MGAVCLIKSIKQMFLCFFRKSGTLILNHKMDLSILFEQSDFNNAVIRTEFHCISNQIWPDMISFFTSPLSKPAFLFCYSTLRQFSPMTDRAIKNREPESLSKQFQLPENSCFLHFFAMLSFNFCTNTTHFTCVECIKMIFTAGTRPPPLLSFLPYPTVWWFFHTTSALQSNYNT